MIKKAKDLRPGDVIGDKTIIGVSKSRYGEDYIIRFGMSKDDYLFTGSNGEFLVDEEAPVEKQDDKSEPVETNTTGPFYMAHRPLDRDYAVCHKTGFVCSYKNWEVATDVMNHLNQLFAYRPQVVTKRITDVKPGDQIIVRVTGTNCSFAPIAQLAINDQYFYPTGCQCTNVENDEVQVIKRD